MDFVAFDVETANRYRGSICAIGIAEVEDGRVVRRDSWLCTPPLPLNGFEHMNIRIHGIRPEDVQGMPPWSERMAEVLDVVKERPIIAHNASFDISAIRHACDEDGFEWPTVTYGCTLQMARRQLRLISYRLPAVCKELGIEFADHHDAGSDASAAAEVAISLAKLTGATSLADLMDQCGLSFGYLSDSSWRSCASSGEWADSKPRPPEANPDADPLHPLFGQTIVFTGALGISRQEAFDLAASRGATVKNGVSKKVTMLVVGDGFSGDRAEDFYTGKAAKAAELISEGHAIEVISEPEFHELLVALEEKKKRAKRGRELAS